MTDPTKRFSSRVENYVKYRPGYPDALIELLAARCGLGRSSAVADVGAGTGILTKLLLKTGATVFAVEPNREMREAAERALESCANFRSIAATAEATTLPDASVNIVTAAQAFHWFNPEKTRREFRRILKPDGFVALIWNDRNSTARPFFRAYENLLVTFATDYAAVNHKNVDAENIGGFFGPAGFERAVFANEQAFDFDSLKGRLLSSSYAPDIGHPKCEPMLKELRRIFDEHQSNGSVNFEYDTVVYFGPISG